MRHGDVFRKLGRNTSGRRQLFQNQITSLIRYERIKTTLPKAKELRRVVEKTITKAKHASLKSREKLVSFLKKEEILNKLYNELAAVRYKNRTGGYTRIWLAGHRRGDKAPMGIIELIDAPFDMRKAFDIFTKEKLGTVVKSSKGLSVQTKTITQQANNSIDSNNNNNNPLENDKKTLSLSEQKHQRKKDMESKLLENKSYPLNMTQLKRDRIHVLETKMQELSIKDLFIEKPGLTPKITTPYLDQLLATLHMTNVDKKKGSLL